MLVFKEKLQTIVCFVQMPHTPHTPHTPGSAHTPGGGGAHTPGSSHTPGPPSVGHHSLNEVDIPADLNFDPAAVIDGEGTDNLNVRFSLLLFFGNHN